MLSKEAGLDVEEEVEVEVEDVEEVGVVVEVVDGEPVSAVAPPLSSLPHEIVNNRITVKMYFVITSPYNLCTNDYVLNTMSKDSMKY